MKFSRLKFTTIILISIALVALQACKAKKLARKPAVTHTDTVRVQVPVQETKPQPVEQPKQEAPVEKPNYNFANIQFDFDSSILKTGSYPALDNMATEMKKDLSVKFNVSGFASVEGTEEHNLTLSQDRANAVKIYLVNSGVRADNLMSKGFGTDNPVADNSTDDGRVLNRRVEIKKQD